jgi:hypothetical protein
MTVSGTFSVRVALTGTMLSSNDLSTVQQVVAISKSLDFTNGTSSNQFNTIWMDQRSISASSTEDLDLAGSLTDAFGATITFTAVKGIYVFAATANTNNVEVGGAAANTFLWFKDATDIQVVTPGGVYLSTRPGTGATVTAGTGDILKVANSGAGTSVTYDIAIFGLA